MTNAVQLVAALLLVLLNGFFVAAEFSLARARTTRLEQLAEQGRGSAALARDQVQHIDRYLAACQLGITLASLGLGWLGEPAFAELFEPVFESLGLGSASSTLTAVIIAFVIITVLHVVFGELAPKSIAIQRAEATALATARPLELFRKIFSPFIRLLNGAGNAVVRALGVAAGDRVRARLDARGPPDPHRPERGGRRARARGGGHARGRLRPRRDA